MIFRYFFLPLRRFFKGLSSCDGKLGSRN
ncbi:hypothetical protein TFKS16_2797 [Tannerella forsythia KS16]|nr:hypothetical protein TF3313_2716 [Tannerella forsythia 3313]BAR52970.1 hypothetical protein TFKS16_2797 [Tannerella forsythia KS16]